MAVLDGIKGGSLDGNARIKIPINPTIPTFNFYTSVVSHANCMIRETLPHSDKHCNKDISSWNKVTDTRKCNSNYNDVAHTCRLAWQINKLCPAEEDDVLHWSLLSFRHIFVLESVQ